ncbi:hypothetical protein ANN_04357 [Periplaneta americana]|uniref:HTH psq-type domain-containing protein n=1 Tax=Periplaneta americana TaxID=6978 RepID=A0ABQ8T8C5_PERAM|nr:hypothetical protein ANN_04357 [Periplaneta americana]
MGVREPSCCSGTPKRHGKKQCLELMHNAIIGPFFFLEKTLIGHSRLDVLENFAVPQISLGSTFQQDGTPPHYHQRVYGGVAPDAKSTRLWFNELLTTGNVLKQSGGARRSVTEEKVEEIRAGFQRSPSKSIHQASRRFNVPPKTL